MRVLDLFSGIGGFSLGLERAGMETVAFCEIDKFCQKVLRKHWPDVPIYDDVRTLDYDGTVDVICGGFPCQPFSVAGNRKGKEDDRHLWPVMFTLVKKYKPSWVIGENVAGLINMGLDDVLADLESEGYSTRTFIIPACAANAPHRRDRLWIVANNDSFGRNDGFNNRQGRQSEVYEKRKTQEDNKTGKGWQYESGATSTNASNADDKRFKGGFSEEIQRKSRESREFEGSYKGWREGWPISSPRVCGVDDGIPNRTHRLRSLGNAVVPQIPEIIGKFIMEGYYESN